MRIQIKTKYGDFNQEFSDSYNNFKKEYKEKISPLISITAFYCPECGLEYYTIWFGCWVYNQVKKYQKKYPNINIFDTDFFIMKKLNPKKINNLDEYIKNRWSLTCPNCGHSVENEHGGMKISCEGHDVIFSKKGYYAYISNYDFLNENDIENDYLKLIDLIFDKMKVIREEHLLSECKEKIETKAKEYDVKALNNDISFDTNDTEKLKTFLKNILTLEMNIYSLKNWLPHLYVVKNDILSEENLYDFEWKTNIKTKDDRICTLNNELKKIQDSDPVSEIKIKDIKLKNIKKPSPPEQPVFDKPGLLNKKKIEAQNAEMQRKYDDEMKSYEEALNIYNSMLEKQYNEECEKAKDYQKQRIEEIKAETEKLETEIEKLKENKPNKTNMGAAIEKEIVDAEKLLEDTYKCRNQLYGSGIIFGKYHDPVAIATFYEYLVSGRCEKLEGVNGAYNLYEKELQTNIIIAKLTEVIENLEQIKQSQFTICSVIQDVKDSLNDLSCTLNNMQMSFTSIERNTDTVAHNSSVIAYNTAATAYYSRINAELTAALGFVAALK